MSTYTPNGLVDLGSVNSDGRSQRMTFVGRNQVAPTPVMSAASLMPVPPPFVPPPNHAFGVPLSGPTGLMVFPENVPTRIYASSSPYAELEAPVEACARARAHVQWMLEHPYEETWRYKVKCVLEVAQSLIWRVKQRAVQISRPVVMTMYEGLESCLDCAAEFHEFCAFGYGIIRYQMYADLAIITGVDLV